jgi:hypothetical protein
MNLASPPSKDIVVDLGNFTDLHDYVTNSEGGTYLAVTDLPAYIVTINGAPVPVAGGGGTGGDQQNVVINAANAAMVESYSYQ